MKEVKDNAISLVGGIIILFIIGIVLSTVVKNLWLLWTVVLGCPIASVILYFFYQQYFTSKEMKSLVSTIMLVSLSSALFLLMNDRTEPKFLNFFLKGRIGIGTKIQEDRKGQELEVKTFRFFPDNPGKDRKVINGLSLLLVGVIIACPIITVKLILRVKPMPEPEKSQGQKNVEEIRRILYGD